MLLSMLAYDHLPVSFGVIPTVNPQLHSGLSASLRERLKRTRRSFISPLSVAKRLCVDSEEEEDAPPAPAGSQETITVHTMDANRTEVKLGSERLPSLAPQPSHMSSGDLALQLRKEVKEKTETLRRLKMVKMYRSKVSVESSNIFNQVYHLD